MSLDATIRIEFTNGEDKALVSLERPITVSAWVRWHIFVMVPGAISIEFMEESHRRAMGWLLDITGLEMPVVVELCERFGGSIEIGEHIIKASAMPGALGTREWMNVTFGGQDYDPTDLPKNAPCHCFYCRAETDERDESCTFYGLKTQAGVVADIDMELAWSMWDAPLPVYQLSTMKRRATTQGQLTKEQKRIKDEIRHTVKEDIWAKSGLRQRD